MKKRLTAFFAAVFLLFSLSEAADASSSTYRNQLGRIENEIYDAMASYLPQGYDSFSYEFSQPAAYASAEEANSSLQTQVSRAYEAFYRDYPDVFCLDKSGVSFSAQYYTASDVLYISGFSLKVAFTASSYQSQKAALEQAVNAILQGASGTDYDKARYFHDAILDRCSYNSGAVSVYQPMSCEAYGALVEGSAICEGYAKAFKLLCNRAGIACEIVGGTVNGEAHMWNYVQIGGDYYLVDATFDDAPGVGAYDYFLKGSSSVWDHLEDSSLLEGFSTGFSYPSLSSSDYLPSGADGRNTAETDNQTPAPADEEIVSAADATETGQAGAEEESIPATGRHPAVVPPVEEGECRISCLFSKNGRYWVKSADPSVFIRGKQSLPEGVNLQIFAFPEPGYRVAEITVISGDTAFSVQNCSSLAFSLEKDSQIRVVFEKAA